VPYKKRWYFPIDFNSIFLNIIKDNKKFNYKTSLEHNDFVGNFVKIFNHVMLVYATSKI